MCTRIPSVRDATGSSNGADRDRNHREVQRGLGGEGGGDLSVFRRVSPLEVGAAVPCGSHGEPIHTARRGAKKCIREAPTFLPSAFSTVPSPFGFLLSTCCPSRVSHDMIHFPLFQIF